MVAASVASNGAQGRVIIDPAPRAIAAQLRKLGNGLDAELKKLNRRYADVPMGEVERRARALGGGFVRIAQATRAAAQAKGVVLRAGDGRFLDFAGWEFGAGKGYRMVSAPVFGRTPRGAYRKRTTRQFPDWRGNDAGAGYVIHPIMRDEPFMARFGENYARGLDDFLREAFPD